VRENTFFYGKGNENHELGADFFVHKRIISEAKSEDFVSDRKSYIRYTKKSLMSYHCSERSCPNRR
jgi:hypothetical protein